MTTKNIFTLFAVLIVISLFGFGWYQNQGENREPVAVNNELPAGWSWQESQACDLRLPLPPPAEPYISDTGEYWRYQENPQSNQFFNHNAIAIFHNPELGGSGYVAGAVSISCAPNTNRDTTETLVARYADYLTAQNENIPPEAQMKLHLRQSVSLWDQEVLIVNYEGGMFDPTENYYFLATDDNVYLISKPKHSGDEFIRQTTKEIFMGLNFNL